MSKSFYKAGAASESITPDESLWLAGYAARTTPSQGKISDLYASALTLEDAEGNRIVIASIDLIAITPIISEPVIEAVQRQIALPRERLLLACSHTHYGPECRPDKALFFKIPTEFAAKIPAVAKQLADALIRVIIASTKNAVPVKLIARQSSADFAHNRRRGGIKDAAPSTQDVVDNAVPILDIISTETDLRKAIVFGYACHNTTILPDDCRYCGDWAGFAKEQLQRANTGTTALFIAGCGADQNPEPRGSVELSKEYGTQLANEVQAAMMRDDGVEITGAIRAARIETSLAMKPLTRELLDAMLASDDPPKRVKAKFLLDQIARGQPLLESYSAPIQAIRIGDQLLMIALPGEPVVDWARKFKQEFAGEFSQVWIAGYCNDMFGYLPTRRIQAEGGYEGGRAQLWNRLPSEWTEDVEDRITARVRQVVAKLT